MPSLGGPHVYEGRYDSNTFQKVQQIGQAFLLGFGAGGAFGLGIGAVIASTALRNERPRAKLRFVLRTGLQTGASFGLLITVATLIRAG